MKKKTTVFALSSLLLFSGVSLASCGETSSSTLPVVEDYYVINTTNIRTEILVGHELELNPTFTNLGEPATPKYSVLIMNDGNDVTSTVYNADTKIFHPAVIGSYNVTFTVLKENGEVYETADGKVFSKSVLIEVVTESFAPVNNDGPDVSVSSEGVITFGNSYSAGSSEKIDSNQYKVTGVSFDGSYSITYELKNIKRDEIYEDPALYFGWNKQWEANNDDSIKLSTGDGSIAAWIWGENGDPADLSVNRLQGWNKSGWWNAPRSVSGGSPISGDHTITFERYVNKERNTAVYGIIYDDNPITYLNIGDAYTDFLNSVWVESNNTSGSISVKGYKEISDDEKPTLALNYTGEYTVGDTINLKNGAQITDNSAYGNVLVPSFQVFDAKGDEVAVVSGTFTPSEPGEYTVKSKVSDLMLNEATAEAKINVKKLDLAETVIDVSETSPVAMDNNGIVLYYSASKGDVNVPITSIKAMQNGEDVTENTIFTYTAKTADNMSYPYFKAPEGNYVLEFTAEDGTKKTKDISVGPANTTVYGFTYYDLNHGYQDKFIVGKDMIIYTNNGEDKQTAKISPAISKAVNWEISFDVTDLSYTKQGKLMITKNTKKADNSFVGWEDLAIGGNVKGDGTPDLWGYECSVIGTGWTSYQWRSNWQNPTTEFMPDPTDPTKGCGRPADQYTQYGYGTHHYSMNCEMDENGKVTYKYYIDNELEVVHHTAAEHDFGNVLDFIQFSSVNMNGIVTNIKVQSK